MTMRTFAGTLLLENIFDYVPTSEMQINNLGLSIFTPNVLIVEDNCHTTLGKFENLTFESEGLYELATEDRLSYDRITTLLSSGVYSVATRHTSTCISQGGICKKCYNATYPGASEVKVNDRVTIRPEYLANSEIIEVIEGVSVYPIKTNPSSYDKYYVFLNGDLITEGTQYVISNGSIVVAIPLANINNIVIRFIKIDRTPFLAWLADTYSGSLLGMEPIPKELLPVRPLFLSSTLLENRLQSISELIKTSKNIPKEFSGYIDQIKDPLEKALYMLAIYSIYYNVSY